MKKQNYTTTGKKSKYAAKKEQMRSGTYNGTSPFFNNIPEYQFLKPMPCSMQLENLLRAQYEN